MSKRRLIRKSRGTCSAGIVALLSLFGSCALAQNAVPNSGRPSEARVLLLGIAASGVIEKILVASGDRVKAGQVLLQLECRPLEAEVKSRMARRDALQAAYERTFNGPRVEEIAIAEAKLGVAQAREEEAHKALGRATALTEGITITRAQFLETQRNARVAAAQLEDARKGLALLKAGSRVEDIAEASARRDEADAAVAEAKAQLDQCSLRAPVDGTVEITATLGQYVSDHVPAILLTLTPASMR